jgi:hypothetical protein
MPSFAPGRCGWRSDSERERLQAQAERAERRAAQRQRQEAPAPAADGGLWCRYCGRGERRHPSGRCALCLLVAALNCGLALRVVELGRVGG